jgi:acyl carrier protein
MHECEMRECPRVTHQRINGNPIQAFMKAASPSSSFTALKELIMESLVVDPDDIRPGARLIDDLGAEAVEVADLLVAVEQEWDIEITHEIAARLRTVQDVVDYIEESAE